MVPASLITVQNIEPLTKAGFQSDNVYWKEFHLILHDPVLAERDALAESNLDHDRNSAGIGKQTI